MFSSAYTRTSPVRHIGPFRPRRFLLLLYAFALSCDPRTLEANESGNNLFRLFSRPSSSVSTTPHPAVVRVIVEEGKTLATGTGSLVSTRDQYGLVVTNWHVVREATGKIEVVFPDGFRSAATVLKTDVDWDLAALLVWRSNVVPLAISNQAPQPGDVLTIAGYGPGDYRAISGKCTQYVAPSEKHPFEMVELSAQARQGDSGGPILNERGELAGVLFGSNRGSTSGTYCVRVRSFLATVWPDLESPYTMPQVQTPLVGFEPSKDDSAELSVDMPVQTPLAAVDPIPPSAPAPESPSAVEIEEPVAVANSPPPPLPRRPSNEPNWMALLGESNWDRTKAVFALIGILTVWGHVARLLVK